MLKLKRDAVIH